MNRETIIQFGTGRFLRGFFDYFINCLNQQGLYDGRIVVIQSTPGGAAERINAQNGVYHLVLRGIENGKAMEECHRITSISRALNPESDFGGFLKLAENQAMRVIISNTTEIGIQFDATASFDDRPPKAYPAKLCRLLHHRFQSGLPGFLIFPCELIDHNADVLRSAVLGHARRWKLGEGFIRWIETENRFCNTLVDRICTGFPAEEAEQWEKKLGGPDALLNTAEPFHLWAVEGNYEEELPFRKAGLNVVWTDDITPYKLRKVRILNGGHTSMVLGASLFGLETVLECMQDETVHRLFRKCVFEEIVPTLGENEETLAFACSVEERFQNPYIRHHLADIAVNSVSKFKVRVLPTIREYEKMFHLQPHGLLFSLAALLAFYRLREPNDRAEYIHVLKEAPLSAILADTAVWGEDLSRYYDIVAPYYNAILQNGMKAAYQMVLEK